MLKYIKIMRLDHWIKQFFILPGFVFAMIMTESEFNRNIIINFIYGFFSTCFIASANYVINEWLDAEFDKYHPTKKYRSVVEEGANKYTVYTIYISLSIIGLFLACLVSKFLFYSELFLLVMGIIYNVKPFRTKDLVYFDVLSESINNAIRLLIGWFIVTNIYYPPLSIIIGYWFAGAFLMAMKRFAEYRMIGDPVLAGKYRKSFIYYSEKSLLISSFFYAMISVMFIGIFLTKYKVELIVFMPFLIGMYCDYLYIAFKDDSAAQKPEKLFKEKTLMINVTFITVLFFILLMAKIDFLKIFTTSGLIPIN